MDFHSALELYGLVKQYDWTIEEIMIKREISMSGQTESAVINRIMEIYKVMKVSVSEGGNNTRKTMGGLIDGQAKKLIEYANKGSSILPYEVLDVVAWAIGVLEVNANIGKIVA